MRHFLSQQELQDVQEQFELLKQKHLNKTLEDQATDRLQEILKEIEDMQRQMEDRLQQIEGYNHQTKSCCRIINVLHRMIQMIH